jgi:hypothetical protein
MRQPVEEEQLGERIDESGHLGDIALICPIRRIAA